MLKTEIQKLLKGYGWESFYSGKTRTLHVTTKQKFAEIVIGQKYGFLPDFKIEEVIHD